jgi:peptide/nickel transport system permease protein
MTSKNLATQDEKEFQAGFLSTPFGQRLVEFFENRLMFIAVAVLILIVIVSVFASWIAPFNPYDLEKVNILNNLLPPGSKGLDGETFWIGTDGAGRDLLSAILYGMRISIGVALVSGFIALMIGTLAGLVAGYVGGRTETVIMRIVDIQLSFPAILVALILVTLLGRGVEKTVMALVVVQWAFYARTVRSTAIVERRKEYVEAAICVGLSHRRIILGHLLPNCAAPLIVVGTMQTANAIALEATLSFLGVGLPITEPSLGLLISNGFEYMLSAKYWISFFPGLALLLTIVDINLVGDRLREVLNPRMQR